MEFLYFAAAMTSDEFNTGLAQSIGAFFAAIYAMLQPLFAAIGFLTVLALGIKLVFRRRR